MLKPLLTLILFLVACNSDQKNNEDFIEIDFKYIKQKIIIPVEINNEIYQFCLDTGSKTTISKDLYKKLNPKVQNEINISDGKDSIRKIETVLVDSIKIGTIQFSNINVLSYEQNKIFKCFEFDGYIGSDLLLDYVVQIDLDSKKIKFSKNVNSLSINKKNAQEMVLINDQGSPYVWIRFDDTKNPFKDFVMVDTGMYGIYDLSLDTYERLLKNHRINIIAKGEGASTVGAFGIGEKKDQYLFHFPEFTIGNFSIKNYVNNGTYASNSRIGAELLEHGKMTFDFINEKFYFDFKEKEFEMKQYKRNFNPTFQDEKFIVGIVWEEELKDKIQFGDQILEVNGKDLTKIDICELVLGPSIFKKGNTHRFKFKNKKDSTFVLNLKKESLFFKD
ncbi:aspartyl protease family protein [Flavobacteriaceae bacterium]|nr:aspartyl protease family protein [Flavobacteriaceae bacterium]